MTSRLPDEGLTGVIRSDALCGWLENKIHKCIEDCAALNLDEFSHNEIISSIKQRKQVMVCFNLLMTPDEVKQILINLCGALAFAKRIGFELEEVNCKRRINFQNHYVKNKMKNKMLFTFSTKTMLEPIPAKSPRRPKSNYVPRGTNDHRRH